MAKSLASSGPAEVYGEREQLLDGMIHEMREKSETERDVKDKRTVDDNRILQAREDMRETAIKRRRRLKMSPFPGSIAGNHSDGELELIQKDMEMRKAADAAQYILQKECLSLEQNRETTDAEHQFQIKEIEARRVAIEERRTALGEKRLEAEKKSRKKSLTSLTWTCAKHWQGFLGVWLGNYPERLLDFSVRFVAAHTNLGSLEKRPEGKIAPFLPFRSPDIHHDCHPAAQDWRNSNILGATEPDIQTMYQSVPCARGKF